MLKDFYDLGIGILIGASIAYCMGWADGWDVGVKVGELNKEFIIKVR